ncbi:MAG TPA: adenylate/guanylate cyclase domain-containing protein [Bacteroidia bacterium]|jgi:class 3 adenylate cyclase|nr:adenylate/guanylate cyclase domain-containing protein [Bacteroidia bacterium]
MESTERATTYSEKLKQKGFVVRNWLRVINIGVDENTSVPDRKRARLLNGISFIALMAYLGNTASLLKHEFSLIECFVAIGFILFTIYLNSLKRYNLACHVYNVFNLLFYSFMGIVQGANDATELYLIPSSLLAMMFFRKTSTILIYFLLNLIFFGIVKYCHTVLQPLNVFPEQHNLFISNYILLFVILFSILLHFRSENFKQETLLEERNEKLGEEKQRSEDLLLNILPAETAEELKTKGRADAREYDLVTVLFTDFKNFTKASEMMTAQEMVNEINYCYSAFDRILAKYGVEKIKTIGDGYMAAGGLPVKNDTNPADAVNAAIDIRNFMELEKERRIKEGKTYFEIRIGLHSGPVVAGIVGIKKFAYDIWGDTVNTASRMESSGETGKVNISGSTYELVKDKFTCTYRGKILAKNKGEIDMYFVES